MYRKLFVILQVIVLSISSPVFAESSADAKKGGKKPSSYYFRQFQEVFNKIDQDYVQEADHQEMTDEAINGMLQSLDPYSGYYTDDDLEFFLNQTEGEFGGIGIEMIYENGAIKVISPLDDTPAYKAGIKAGDYILAVNGQLVSDMGYNKAAKEIRGEPNTKLNLLILKENDSKPTEIELAREIIKSKPIKYEFENDELGGIGYVRVSTFNKNTTNDLKKAIKELEQKSADNKKQLKGIILDLRNNPGGLLEQAVDMGEYFIESGVIVITRGREKETEKIISASKFRPKAPNVPIVVLINSGSASASEIVAGALQDHKRAVLLGTTSFGKGLVQTFTKINDRAAVKITTAKYYTPSGRSINAEGIVPDVYIENVKVDYKDKDADNPLTRPSIKTYLEKYNTDKKDVNVSDKDKEDKDKKSKKYKELLKDKKAPQLSKKYKEDYQYARAYDLIRGLIITGSNR